MKNSFSLQIDSLSDADLDLELESLTIHTKDENKGIKAYVIDEATHSNIAIHNNEGKKDNLETLGYSFEVGV